MAFYKYCNEAGKFILQNLEIKVTPPNELNDLCEMRPVVKNSDPNAWARRFAQKALTDPAYYNKNPGAFPNCKNFRQFQTFARGQLHQIIARLEQTSPALDAELQKDILGAVSKKWGIVSLSANPVNERMWDLYADSHKGIVVEFDQTNALFGHPSFLKCEYDDNPAIYDSLQGPNHEAVEEFARRKRAAWSYEEESRLIVPLGVCRQVTRSTPKMYLFSIEPNVVKSVTFGLRCPAALRQEVLTALNRAEVQHVTKWQIIEGAIPGDLKRALIQ
jgi:hypothetical protein